MSENSNMRIKNNRRRKLSAGLMAAVFLLQFFPGCSGMGDWRNKQEKKEDLSEIKIFRETRADSTPVTTVSADMVPAPKNGPNTGLKYIDPKVGKEWDVGNDNKEKEPFYMELTKNNNKPMDVKLDFINGVTIPELVGLFSTQLGFQFSVDKEVSAIVSIKLSTEMTPVQMWQLLERLLWMNNAFLTYKDGIVWIRPNLKMVKEPGVAIHKQGDGNVSVRVFRLKSVEAKSVMESLKPFVTEGGLVSEIQGQNSLLIIDNDKNMEKLTGIVEAVDQIADTDWHRALFPVEHISPSRLRYELEQILTILGFPVAGAGGTGTTARTPTQTGGNNKFGAIRMVPLDRIQGMLVMAATKDAIEEVGQWITLLDNSDHSGQEQIYVYQVVNSRASDLGETLKTMFNVEVSTRAAEETSIGGESGNRKATSTNTTRIQSSNNTSNNRTSSNNRTNNDAAQAGPGSVFEIPGSLFADDEQNRMIIKTTPQVYSMMKAILNRIDTVPSQVQLQVVISEIRLDDSMSLGAEFNYKSGNNTFGTDYADLSTKVGDDGKRAAAGSGFNYLFSTGEDKFAYLNALASKGRVEIVASPTVMVIGNKTAQVKIGEEVPIITNYYSNTQSMTVDYGTMSNTVEYKETGVLLTITPRITKGGLIQIDFTQTLSEVQKTTSSDIQSPTILKRSIETTMALRDGATLIVGGLINDVRTSRVNSLPIMTDIPVLNFLFGTNNDDNKRTELVIMVTGHVINEETPLEATIARYGKSIDLVRNMEKNTIREISGKPSPYSFSKDPKQKRQANRENKDLVEKVTLPSGSDVQVILMDQEEERVKRIKEISPENMRKLEKLAVPENNDTQP